MFKRFKVAALAAVVVLAAGCGAVMQQVPQDPTDVLGFRALDGGAPAPFHGPLARQLGLTADQQAQIKAILAQHRPPQPGQHLAELKALLTAETVDQAALKAWVEARKAQFQSHQSERLAVAGELRAVLTDDQRAKLLAQLAKDPPAGHPHLEAFKARMRQHLVGDLGLTAGQQAQLDALHTQLEALRDPARGKAMREAIAAFVQSGDQAALGAAMQGQLDGRFPVDAVIAFAASLDQGQRTKLVERLGRFHPGK